MYKQPNYIWVEEADSLVGIGKHQAILYFILNAFAKYPFLLDIPYLREFALNNNPLQKIESNAFEMIPQIVSLDLSGEFLHI